MVAAVLLLLAGTVILTVGAEWSTRGAAAFATARGISPFVLGALLFGIDLESLGAVVIAAGRGQTALAAGEAFGTIVFLLSAAFGAALVLSRKPIESPSTDMVLVPGVALVVGALTLSDGVISRLEGIGLIAVFAIYLWMLITEGRMAGVRGKEMNREAERVSSIAAPLVLVAGLGLVFLGATVLVSGGIRLVDRTALAAGFVGAAIIGALVSLDEVLLEVLPILRGHPELATGNLFGTIAAFATGVPGLAAIIRPLETDGSAGAAFIAASSLYAIVASAFLIRGKAGRIVGLTVLAAYAGWLAFAGRA